MPLQTVEQQRGVFVHTRALELAQACENVIHDLGNNISTCKACCVLQLYGFLVPLRLSRLRYRSNIHFGGTLPSRTSYQLSMSYMMSLECHLLSQSGRLQPWAAPYQVYGKLINVIMGVSGLVVGVYTR